MTSSTSIYLQGIRGGYPPPPFSISVVSVVMPVVLGRALLARDGQGISSPCCLAALATASR